MTQAVILHTIQDAEHHLQQGLYKDAELFSFNVQVVTYLHYQRGVVCHNLCSYVDSEEVLYIQETALQGSNALLAELDHQVASSFNQAIGLSMRYFTPLYSYTGARQLAIYAIIVRCLERMIAQYSSNTVLLYDGVLGPLNQRIDITFLKKLLPTVKFRTIRYEMPAEGREKTIISGIPIEKVALLLEKSVPSKAEASKQNMVVFEPADKLKFLLQQPLDKVNIYDISMKSLHYPIEYKISPRILPPVSSLQSVSTAGEDRQNMLVLLYEILSEDFCRHIIQHLRLVQTYRNIQDQAPIHRAYWEIPSYKGACALVLEYLMTNQVTQVTGVKSKGTFFVGQTNSAYVDVAVYSRCHQYLTPEILPVSPVMAELVIKTAKTVKPRKPVDVAIYLTPTSSFTQTGQNLSTVVVLQEDLLTFLETQCNKEIHVVVYNNPSFENCAMLAFLKTLTNVTLIQDAKLDKYLSKYVPKLVLLDSPMPFLADVLHEEIPVILMRDPMITFSDEVLTLLKQRVYYADEMEEAKQLLQEYFKGNLEKKRDRAYVDKFCSDGLVQDKILQEING